MEAEKQIEIWVQEWLADKPELFLVKVKRTAGKLLVLMDGDKGITIRDCSGLSRMLSHKLEENELIDTAFTLEVSSPGADEPLANRRQYEKNIGRSVQVGLKEGLSAEGKLVEIFADKISIEQARKEKGKKSFGEIREIAFDDIMETKIIFSFK